MFVPLRSYDSYIPANLMLQRLEAEGIRGYLQDEHSVTINPLFANAVGGIKLMIFESQIGRAEELLHYFE